MTNALISFGYIEFSLNMLRNNKSDVNIFKPLRDHIIDLLNRCSDVIYKRCVKNLDLSQFGIDKEIKRA